MVATRSVDLPTEGRSASRGPGLKRKPSPSPSQSERVLELAGGHGADRPRLSGAEEP
jgi:hypothetical protein